MNKTENKKKENILIKAKKIVSIEGWSSEIFSKLQKQNIEKNDLFYFFPDGYKDLLEYTLQNINEKLEYKFSFNGIFLELIVNAFGSELERGLE